MKNMQPKANITVLGISGLYHDSAAAIVHNGEILAAAAEERFTRRKHDASLPVHAIDFCLQYAQTSMPQVDAVVYYDQPLLTADRFLHETLRLGAAGADVMPERLADVAARRLTVDEELRRHYGILGKTDTLLTLEHHLSHAASAFYPSPFESAAVLTIDGVGEWTTTAIGRGAGSRVELLKELSYPHSLGLFYSACSAFCGFRVNSGEYKFMGLAPYGEPIYADLIRDNLINLRPDGSFRLNMDYFCFDRSKHMTGEAFAALFGGPARVPESRITRREMDIAASVQQVTEEAILSLAREARRVTEEKNLVLAGGTALNCVANGKLQRSGIFDRIWIQSAAGDDGGALGCALYAYYALSGAERRVHPEDAQQGSALGPAYSTEEAKMQLDALGAVYHEVDEKQLCAAAAQALDEGKAVGWHQGRMEFGPRALGQRSILGDARSAEMQQRLNLKVKYRESFRPFAPSVLLEDAGAYFDLDGESPYMLMTSYVNRERRLPFNRTAARSGDGDLLPLVRRQRSDIPAVTHVDYSARVQTVTEARSGRYARLLQAFRARTGCSLVVNTSFNVRGEPIVNSPADAYRCFMRTELDVLAVGNLLLFKEEQQIPGEGSGCPELSLPGAENVRPKLVQECAFLLQLAGTADNPPTEGRNPSASGTEAETRWLSAEEGHHLYAELTPYSSTELCNLERAMDRLWGGDARMMKAKTALLAAFHRCRGSGTQLSAPRELWNYTI